MTAIADVIVEPQRIEIIESIGSGEINRCIKFSPNDGDTCDVVVQVILVRFTRAFWIAAKLWLSSQFKVRLIIFV